MFGGQVRTCMHALLFSLHLASKMQWAAAGISSSQTDHTLSSTFGLAGAAGVFAEGLALGPVEGATWRVRTKLDL